jgi:hypothetical protein
MALQCGTATLSLSVCPLHLCLAVPCSETNPLSAPAIDGLVVVIVIVVDEDAVKDITVSELKDCDQ